MASMANLPPSVFTQEIAGILRGARARQNINQSVIAEAIDVNQSQLSKMLRGERPITLDQLDIMCEILSLDLVDVLREADEETSARSGHNKVVMRLRDTNGARARNGADPYREDLHVVADWGQVAPLKEPTGANGPLTDAQRGARIPSDPSATQSDYEAVGSTESVIEGSGEEQ